MKLCAMRNYFSFRFLLGVKLLFFLEKSVPAGFIVAVKLSLYQGIHFTSLSGSGHRSD